MKQFLYTIGFISLILSPLAVAGSSTDPTAGNPVLLDIDGARFTLSDLEGRKPTALFQARNAFHDAQRKAIDELIGEILLERQAKKEGVTVAKLLEMHVNSTIAKDPSEEALRVYYDGLDTKESFEAVHDRLVDAIRQRRIAKAKDAYMASLRSQAKVTLLLTPPRTHISLDNTPVRGGADSPVVLVEYADYECPYCQQIQPALDKLLADYKGKLGFAYKDVPLPMHSNAQKAAEATRCAAQQGKYWEFHDLLYTAKALQVPQLKEGARALKLDGAAFDKCLDSDSQAELVKSHLAEAQALGLPGTPGFFVNGRVVTGAISYESLRLLVEEELAARERANAVKSASSR